MKNISRRDYEMFEWLPIDRWSVNTIMGPALEFKIMCKICDEYVIMSDSDNHVQSHVKQRSRQIENDRRKAKEMRLEKLRLAREEKANNME